MDVKERLNIQINDRFTTIINIISYDEERVIDVFKQVLAGSDKGLFIWDSLERYHTVIPCNTEIDGTRYDALSVLDKIGSFDDKAVFILKDYHRYWDEPCIIRKLRNLSVRLRETGNTVVILSPVLNIPVELKDDISIIKFPPLSYQEIEKIFDNINNGDKPISCNKERLLRAGLGLSSNQVRRVFSRVMLSGNIDMLNDEKRYMVADSNILKFCNTSEVLDDVGGVSILKMWLKKREKAFTKEATEYKLPVLKGIALIGISGIGKSLIVKAIPNLWNIPLLQVNNMIIRDSEENMEKAILLAEAISPCVLWIDNIDKVFPGDDRASMRTLSMFISWMQQKTKPVFTIITSNNIEGLPVELLCKSVFDEIFFIDLPILEERVDIFYAHLRKRRPETYKKYDVEMLAEKTRGFVGAEIEQVIIDAMYNAFDDNKREFTENDIVNSIKRIIPVSRLQRDKVEYFREWLVEGKVISASSEGVIKEERNGIVLEI